MEDFLKEMSETGSFRIIGPHWAAGAGWEAEPMVPRTHLHRGHGMGLNVPGLLLFLFP